MTTYSRDIEIERAEVDLETGKIASVPVFTGGEASDGHILNVHGAKRQKDMPWFVQHEADPRTQLGTLYSPRVENNALVYDGEILSEGDGAAAEVRRDILLKVARGHVKRLSGKWDADPKHVKRRIELPPDHYAYVDESKATGAERYGFYFHKFSPMEGSFVGLGSDNAAQLREWSEDKEATDAVRGFWRSQAEAYEDQHAATEEHPHEFYANDSDTDITLTLDPRDEPSEEAQQAAGLASVRTEFQRCIALGLETPEILREIGCVVESIEDRSDDALGVDTPTEPEADEDLLERIVSLEERLVVPEPATDEGRVEDDDPPASTEPERVEADPLSAQEPEQEAPGHRASPLAFDAGDIVPGVDGETLGKLLRELLDEHEQRLQLKVQAIFDKRLGRVSQ